MNFQVNLLFDSEKRSGSAISLQFTLRFAAIVIPILLLVVIFSMLNSVRLARQNLEYTEQEKTRLEPIYQSVLQLQQQAKLYQHMDATLNGWSASRIAWYDFLRNLQIVIAPSVQLQAITIEEKIELISDAPTRTAGMLLKGEVSGASGEEDVRLLDQALREKPPFQQLFAQVAVKRFEASENIMDKDTRLFEIECVLRPQKICDGAPKPPPAPKGRAKR